MSIQGIGFILVLRLLEIPCQCRIESPSSINYRIIIIIIIISQFCHEISPWTYTPMPSARGSYSGTQKEIRTQLAGLP